MLYIFHDNDELPCSREAILLHLTECSPCQQQFTAQDSLRSAIGQALAGDCAPVELRSKLLATITEIEIEVTAEYRDPQ